MVEGCLCGQPGRDILVVLPCLATCRVPMVLSMKRGVLPKPRARTLNQAAPPS